MDKPLRAFVLALVLPQPALAVGGPCPGEAVFHCRLDSATRSASLCVMDMPETGEPYLQYRMHRHGKPELVFPETGRPGKSQFEYWSVHGRQVVQNSIEFDTGRTQLEVGTLWLPKFDDAGRRVRADDAGPESFVKITANGGKAETFDCAALIPLDVPALRNVVDMMKDRP